MTTASSAAKAAFIALLQYESVALITDLFPSVTALTHDLHNHCPRCRWLARGAVSGLLVGLAAHLLMEQTPVPLRTGVRPLGPPPGARTHHHTRHPSLRLVSKVG